MTNNRQILDQGKWNANNKVDVTRYQRNYEVRTFNLSIQTHLIKSYYVRRLYI